MNETIKKLDLSNEEVKILSTQIRDFKQFLNLENAEDKGMYNDLLSLNIKLIDGDNINEQELHMLSKLVVKFEKSIYPKDLTSLDKDAAAELEATYATTGHLKSKIYNAMGISKDLIDIAVTKPNVHTR